MGVHQVKTQSGLHSEPMDKGGWQAWVSAKALSFSSRPSADFVAQGTSGSEMPLNSPEAKER